MANLDITYRHAPDIVSRNIAGEMILVPIRNNVGDLESIYTLNETAALIWELLDGEHTLRAVRDAVVTEFEVEPSEAEQDMLDLIEQLERLNAVQVTV